MMLATVQITESAKALIDSRLDTIDRMLLGRVPRADRLAIVKEVEAQIHERLHERDAEDLDREEVLAVLAQLDPPEAYLPEDGEPDPAPSHITVAPRPPRYGRRAAEPTLGRASGVLGICALAMLLLYPLSYLGALVLENEFVLFLGWGLAFLSGLVGGIVGLVLGACARPMGPWSIAGMVTNGLALVFALGAAALMLLMVMNGL